MECVNTNSNSNLYSPDSFGNEEGKTVLLSKNKRACVRCVVWCNAMNAKVL